MWSFVNTIFTQRFIVFRFQRLVLPVKCRLEPINKHGETIFRLLVFVPRTHYFSLRYPLSFCSFGLRFFYSRILFLPFLYTLFVYSRFLPFSPFDLSVRLVQCLFLTPHSWQQCCCIATDKSQNSALFIPAQPLVNKRVFFVLQRTLEGVQSIGTSDIMSSLRLHRLTPWNRTRTLDPQAFQFPFRKDPPTSITFK